MSIRAKGWGHRTRNPDTELTREAKIWREIPCVLMTSNVPSDSQAVTSGYSPGASDELSLNAEGLEQTPNWELAAIR